MGQTHEPSLVRLVVGVLARDPNTLESAVQILVTKYGSLDFDSGNIPFTWTNYYQKELGDSPIRRLLAFETLIHREEIVACKLQTNALESDASDARGRPFNLDPGYMTLGQFFLATTKDQRQRVYISRGIYVEPTLFFQDGHFHTFDWTYRDYASPVYLEWFDKARERLAYQHRTGVPWSLRNQ